ncbi:N-acetyltransferase [Salmonella enterica]|nr:N-acetyltransferase [Salmonella enterica]
MLIRVEIPIDAPGIDALLRRSFESDAEAKLVHDLREDGFLTLGLVATDDEGQVVGYVAFSPVDVQGEDLGTESAFQVHRLAEDALEGVTGLVEYHDHFNRF